MSQTLPIEYRFGNDLDLDEVLDLYRASTLAERRPLDDRAILADMLAHANLVVTAWDGDRLVGIARTLTDFSYVGYLADLAVRESHQKRGVGVALIEKTRERMGPRSMLVLTPTHVYQKVSKPASGGIFGGAAAGGGQPLRRARHPATRRAPATPRSTGRSARRRPEEQELAAVREPQQPTAGERVVGDRPGLAVRARRRRPAPRGKAVVGGLDAAEGVVAGEVVVVGVVGDVLDAVDAERPGCRGGRGATRPRWSWSRPAARGARPSSGPPIASELMIDHQESVCRSRITSDASSSAPEASSSSVRPATSRP
jgi:GNAT superfamily N-acetyltransferase